MKMSLIEKEPTHKIKDIWKEYHEPRVANTADVLSKDQYNHIVNKWLIWITQDYAMPIVHHSPASKQWPFQAVDPMAG